MAPFQLVAYSLMTNTYCYDAVGNMVHRNTNRQTPQTLTQTLTYDAENRLIQLHDDGNQYAPIATYAYDGDGMRVRATINGVTTLYVGGHTEFRIEAGTPSTQTLVSYYYAGIQRVAMREKVIGGTNTLYYLLSDHLGSTSATLDTAGYKLADLRYNAWGVERWTDGTTPTNHRFTGQISDQGTGLYFYNARYYDPVLSRFTQADTLVPEPSSPQTFNRYSYVNNNPVKYTDSSGNCVDQDQSCWQAEFAAKDSWYRARGYRYNGSEWAFDPNNPLAEVDNATVGRELLAEAGISLEGDWTDAQIIAASEGVGDLSRAVGSVGRLKQLIGGYATFYHPSEPLPLRALNCFGGPACALPPPFMDGHSVYFRDVNRIDRYDTVHEIAHVIDWQSSITYNYEYYFNGALYTSTATGSYSTVWGIKTTNYSGCLKCVPNWERWAEGVALYVYGTLYPFEGARNLFPWESDIMRRLLSGQG